MKIIGIDHLVITETPMPQIISHLSSCSIEILAGPLQKSAAAGPPLSINIQNPDSNLIEIANQKKNSAETKIITPVDTTEANLYKMRPLHLNYPV